MPSAEVERAGREHPAKGGGDQWDRARPSSMGL